MAMGAFTRKNSYEQEDAMNNANAMAYLQNMRAKQFEGIGGAVDEWGQSRQRGKVAELMGTDEYKNANPEEALAMELLQTGGRDLGENHRKKMDISYEGKGDVRKNTWDEEAATLSNSRANARQAQGNANAIALEGLRQKNRNALGLANGTISGGKSGDMTAELMGIQTRVAGLNRTINDPKSTPVEIEAANSQLLKDNIRAEVLVKNSKVNAGAAGNLMSKVFPNTGKGKNGKAIKSGNRINAQGMEVPIFHYQGMDGSVFDYINSKTGDKNGYHIIREKGKQPRIIDKRTKQEVTPAWVADKKKTRKK